MSYGVSLSFLLIHVAMFFMFRAHGVKPMASFNIFSMAFYLFSFLLIYKNRLYEFVVAAYLEVLLHMCLAVYFTGWENGFQITLIGMNILLFFAEYMGRILETKYIYAAPVCVIGLLSYMLAYLIDYSRPAPYTLPNVTSFILQIAWAIIVFSINIFFLEIFVLMTFHSERFLFKKAGQDELTGLLNRFTANNILDEMIKKGETEKTWISIFDIDDFKVINDTYGHNYGDYVLSTLADIMRKSFGNDSCFRWGGEEFLILGRDEKGSLQALGKLDKFRKSVEEYEFDSEGTKTHLTITGGLAYYEDGLDKQKWINNADIKLYEGKRNGKNIIVS